MILGQVPMKEFEDSGALGDAVARRCSTAYHNLRQTINGSRQNKKAHPASYIQGKNTQGNVSPLTYSDTITNMSHILILNPFHYRSRTSTYHPPTTIKEASETPAWKCGAIYDIQKLEERNTRRGMQCRNHSDRSTDISRNSTNPYSYLSKPFTISTSLPPPPQSTTHHHPLPFHA